MQKLKFCFHFFFWLEVCNFSKVVTHLNRDVFLYTFFFLSLKSKKLYIKYRIVVVAIGSWCTFRQCVSQTASSNNLAGFSNKLFLNIAALRCERWKQPFSSSSSVLTAQFLSCSHHFLSSDTPEVSETNCRNWWFSRGKLSKWQREESCLSTLCSAWYNGRLV